MQAESQLRRLGNGANGRLTPLKSHWDTLESMFDEKMMKTCKT